MLPVALWRRRACRATDTERRRAIGRERRCRREGRWSLRRRRMSRFQLLLGSEKVHCRLLQGHQLIPVLRLQETAVPALLITPAIHRPLLPFLRLVRAGRLGHHTLAPARAPIHAGARIRWPTRPLHCPEDFGAAYRDAA